jgi:hypothetical protein
MNRHSWRISEAVDTSQSFETGYLDRQKFGMATSEVLTRRGSGEGATEEDEQPDRTYPFSRRRHADRDVGPCK